MATFGLVHGAGHGAWCWERLIPALEALGHRAHAMDLPCEDPTAGAERYAEVVDRAIPPAKDLVLVGHSLAGLTVPLVAARRPVRRLVFLCALIPEFGRSLADQLAADPELYHPVLRSHPGRMTDPDGSVWFGTRRRRATSFATTARPRTSIGRSRTCGPRPPRPGANRARCRPGPRVSDPTSSAGRIGPSRRSGRAVPHASAWVSSRSSSTGVTHPSSPGPRFSPGCWTAWRAEPSRGLATPRC